MSLRCLAILFQKLGEDRESGAQHQIPEGFTCLYDHTTDATRVLGDNLLLFFPS